MRWRFAYGLSQRRHLDAAGEYDIRNISDLHCVQRDCGHAQLSSIKILTNAATKVTPSFNLSVEALTIVIANGRSLASEPSWLRLSSDGRRGVNLALQPVEKSKHLLIGIYRGEEVGLRSISPPESSQVRQTSADSDESKPAENVCAWAAFDIPQTCGGFIGRRVVRGPPAGMRPISRFRPQSSQRPALRSNPALS